MKRIYLHPLPLRIWHWVNAVTVVLLLLTGCELRLPESVFFLPRDPALFLHRWAGLALTVLWAFWLLYGLACGTLRRHYALRQRDFGESVRQLKFYLISIFRGEKNPFQPAPEAKFNPLQKWAYGAIMIIIMPAMILTGLSYANAFSVGGHQLPGTVIRAMDIVHVIGLYVLAIFLVIHVYMATLGATAFAHIKAMIVGYEEETDDPAGSSRNSGIETGTADEEGRENQK